MKQKFSIARAVVHSPNVVVFYEPTTVLDIMASQTFIDFIQTLKTQQTPVIFLTHHLDEVKELCDTVTVIDEGTTKYNGDLSSFTALANGSLHHSFLTTIGKG